MNSQSVSVLVTLIGVIKCGRDLMGRWPIGVIVHGLKRTQTFPEDWKSVFTVFRYVPAAEDPLQYLARVQPPMLFQPQVYVVSSRMAVSF